MSAEVGLKTVLMIEASLDDPASFAAILQQNYRVLTASTLEMALQVIQLENPDMVIWGPNLSPEAEALLSQALKLKGCLQG